MSTGAPMQDAEDAASGSAAQALNTKPLFKLMVEKKASDLFFTSNAPVKIKIEGQIMPVNKQINGNHSAACTQNGGIQVNSTHKARPQTMAPTIRMPNTIGPSPASNMA